MAEEVEREYLSSLVDLTVNSKPLINMLTVLADEYIRHAPSIVRTIEKHLSSTEHRLPVLYLIDSIVKNVGKDYIPLFMQNIVSTFAGVFVKVDEKTRLSMWKLRHTWTPIFSARKLHSIDVRANGIDPAWPIQPLPASGTESAASPIAKNPPTSSSTPSLPPAAAAAATKNIHINPKIFKKENSGSTVVPSLEGVGASDDTMDEIVAAQMELLSLQIQAVELQLSQASSDSEKLARTKELLELRTQKAKLELQQATNKLKQKQSKLLSEKSASSVQTGDRSVSTTAPTVSTGKPVIRPANMITASDPRLAAARSVLSDPRIKPVSDPRQAARVSSTPTPPAKTDSPVSSAPTTTTVTVPVVGSNPAVSNCRTTTTAVTKSRSQAPPAPRIRDSLAGTPRSAQAGLHDKSCRSLGSSNLRESGETPAASAAGDTDMRGGRTTPTHARDRPAGRQMGTKHASRTAASSVGLPVTVSMASLPSFKRKRSPNAHAATEQADCFPVKTGKLDDATAKTKEVVEENRDRTGGRTSRSVGNASSSRNRNNGKKHASSRDRDSSKKSPQKSSDRSSRSGRKSKDRSKTVGKQEELPPQVKSSGDSVPDRSAGTASTGTLSGGTQPVSTSAPELSSTGSPSELHPQGEPEEPSGFRRSRNVRGRNFKARRAGVSPEPALVDTDMRHGGMEDSSLVVAAAAEVSSSNDTDLDLRRQPTVSGADVDLRVHTLDEDVDLRKAATNPSEDLGLRKTANNLSEDVDLRKQPSYPPVDVDLRKQIASMTEDVDLRKPIKEQEGDIDLRQVSNPAVDAAATALGDDVDLRPKLLNRSRVGDAASLPPTTPVTGENQSCDDTDLRLAVKTPAIVGDAGLREGAISASELSGRDKSRPLDDDKSVQSSEKARALSGNNTTSDETMDSATDVDLRRSNINNNNNSSSSKNSSKRSRSELGRSRDSPNKKSHLDDLFGAEDTDLRFSESSSANSADQPADAEGGNRGWRQLKRDQPDQYKSPLRARPHPSHTGKDVDMRMPPGRSVTSLTSLQVVTGAPGDRASTPSSALSPALSTSSVASDRPPKPPATQRDLDEDLRLLEESSKLTQNNINMILKQAEDQLKAEEITWEQYNNVLSQVIRLDERQKIREQRAMDRRRSMSTGSSVAGDSDYRSRGQQQTFGPSWSSQTENPWLQDDRLNRNSPPMGPYPDQRPFRGPMAPPRDQTRPFRGGPAPYGPSGARRSGPRGPDPPMFRGRGGRGAPGSVGEWPEPSSEMVAASEHALRERASTYINEKPTDVLWYGENCVCLIDWDEPRNLYFKSGTRVVRIDGRPLLCRFNDNYRPLTVDGVRYQVRLGAPTREVFIDGHGYPLLFGGDPVSVMVDGRPRRLSVEGPPPGVAIGRRRRTDLLCGKIQLLVDGRRSVELYLDSSCQRFVVDGKLHVLRFRHGFDAIEVNGVTLRCQFGSALPLIVHGRRHHICLSRPPAHVPIGRAAVRGMSPDRASWPLPWRDPELAATVSRDVEDIVVEEPLSTTTSTAASLTHQQRATDDRISTQPSAVSCPSESSAAAQNPGVALAPGASGLNIGDLLNRLVKTGLIPAGPQSGEAAKQKELEMNTIADITWKSDSLKHRQPGVISLLYSGIQCSSCGTRFLPEQTVQYSNHLDWHFRQNRRELASSAAQARSWYYDLHSWLAFEEVEDPDDKAEPEFDGLTESVRQNDSEDLSACSAPVGEKDEDNCCQVCHEMMVKFYHEDYEEWHLRNCIRVEGAAYHPSCFEDHKTALLLQSIPQTSEQQESSRDASAAPVLSTATNLETADKAGITGDTEPAAPRSGEGDSVKSTGQSRGEEKADVDRSEEAGSPRASSPDVVFECVRLKSEVRAGPPPLVVTLDDTGTELEQHMEEKKSAGPSEVQQDSGESQKSPPGERQQPHPAESQSSIPGESQSSIPDSGVFSSETVATTDICSSQTTSDRPSSEVTHQPTQYAADVVMETGLGDTESADTRLGAPGSPSQLGADGGTVRSETALQDGQSMMIGDSAGKVSVISDSPMETDTGPCVDEVSTNKLTMNPDPAGDGGGVEVETCGNKDGVATGADVTCSSDGQDILRDINSSPNPDLSSAVEQTNKTRDSSVTSQDSARSTSPVSQKTDMSQQKEVLQIVDPSEVCQDTVHTVSQESGELLQEVIPAESKSDASAEILASSPPESKSSESASPQQCSDSVQKSQTVTEESSIAEPLAEEPKEILQDQSVPEDNISVIQNEDLSRGPDAGSLSPSVKPVSVPEVLSPSHEKQEDSQKELINTPNTVSLESSVPSSLALLPSQDQECAVAIDGELVEPSAPVSSVAPRPGIRLQLACGRAVAAQQGSASGAQRPPEPASIKPGLIGRQIVEQPAKNVGVEESAFCAIM